jgi:putative intracellular protease/amidase
MTRLEGQKALFVVPDGFSEIEYGIPRRILEELGVVITTASWTPDAVTGHRGTEMQPDLILGDAHASEYDAIIFVGGGGVQPTAPETQRIVQEAVAADKVVAAICAAQGILKRAGLLEDERADAVYVERDGRIITASGPIKAREFGEEIAAAMGE